MQFLFMFSLLNIASLYYFTVGLVCVCWLTNMWRYVGKEHVCMGTTLLFYILKEKWPLKNLYIFMRFITVHLLECKRRLFPSNCYFSM